VGLLDFFRRRGASEPRAPEATAGGAEALPDDRAHGVGVPAGSAAEGPPVGVSDPGSLAGDDADEVIAPEEAEGGPPLGRDLND
jgi:hypothetical protein